ncbi:MAG: hypothetical protein JOZ69_07705, partial [Myxococcales bacterium]|nr:hypothetical protein [Myxococcales bacterium]
MGAAPSPQASAEPAVLSNALATATNQGADAGPPPELLRTDRPLEADVPRESAREPAGKEVWRDSRDGKELAGYALTAVVRTGEGPPPLKGSEVNAQAIEAARRRTEARLALELSQTRARFVFSGGFVLPAGTELRARLDRYGHVLLWAGEDTYRIVEPGAMRAFLGERRLDVAPLSPANVTPGGVAGERTVEGSYAAYPARGQHLSLRTRRVEVSTRAARATLELATLRDAGEGGSLVCRWLLDLMNAPPSTPACASDELPLHA